MRGCGYACEYFSWANAASWHAEIRETACLVEAYLGNYDVVLAGWNSDRRTADLKQKLSASYEYRLPPPPPQSASRYFVVGQLHSTLPSLPLLSGQNAAFPQY